jgi:hypothetical protein
VGRFREIQGDVGSANRLAICSGLDRVRVRVGVRVGVRVRVRARVRVRITLPLPLPQQP